MVKETKASEASRVSRSRGETASRTKFWPQRGADAKLVGLAGA